jgi:hypothetical protein
MEVEKKSAGAKTSTFLETAGPFNRFVRTLIDVMQWNDNNMASARRKQLVIRTSKTDHLRVDEINIGIYPADSTLLLHIVGEMNMLREGELQTPITCPSGLGVIPTNPWRVYYQTEGERQASISRTFGSDIFQANPCQTYRYGKIFELKTAKTLAELKALTVFDHLKLFCGTENGPPAYAPVAADTVIAYPEIEVLLVEDNRYVIERHFVV